MMLPLEISIFVIIAGGLIVYMVPNIVREFRRKGKVCVKWWDPETRLIEVGYYKVRGGEFTIEPKFDEPGRRYILHPDCRHDEAGRPTWYVDPRTGINLRAPPASMTSLREDAEGQYRGFLEAFNPLTYFVRMADNGTAEMLTANKTDQKWAWVKPVAIAGACVIGLILILSTVTVIYVTSG